MNLSLGGAVLILVVFAIAFLVLDSWTALGKTHQESFKTGDGSKWRDGKFRNDLPLKNNMWGATVDGFRSGNLKVPDLPVDIYPNDGVVYKMRPSSGLRVTWLGHSTVLLELDDSTILIDPVFSDRVSPFTHLGPKRYYQPPLTIDQLPDIDAVVVSHDHYDHLDQASIQALIDRAQVFIVPLGVDAHLTYWGVPQEKIQTLDWWQETVVGDVKVVATPARHASGRHLFDLDKSLWAGYAFIGSKKIYYSGDTGLFPGFKDIGNRLGPFDITMIEVGAYSRNWPDWHLGPEQAVLAHQWLKGKTLLPLHWGLFNLALHNWTEPMERVLKAAELRNLVTLTPQPGQPYEPGVSTHGKWWPDIPWESVERHAVISSKLKLTDEERSFLSGQQ